MQGVPAGLLQIDVSNVIEGAPLEVTLSGAGPFESLYLIGSATGDTGGPCPTLLGACLDLEAPFLLSQLVTDASGDATWMVPAPLFLPDDLYFQAISASGDLSPSIWRKVQSGPPLPLEICTTGAGLGDDYDQLDLSVNGDTLFLDVSYAGGCQVHEWTPCWDGTYASLQPPRVSLDTYHDSNSDFCQALLYETIAIDLTTLEADYQSTYGGPATLSIQHGGQNTEYDID
jgi:hypothetical protein